MLLAFALAAQRLAPADGKVHRMAFPTAGADSIEFAITVPEGYDPKQPRFFCCSAGCRSDRKRQQPPGSGGCWTKRERSRNQLMRASPAFAHSDTTVR